MEKLDCLNAEGHVGACLHYGIICAIQQADMLEDNEHGLLALYWLEKGLPRYFLIVIGEPPKEVEERLSNRIAVIRNQTSDNDYDLAVAQDGFGYVKLAATVVHFAYESLNGPGRRFHVMATLANCASSRSKQYANTVLRAIGAAVG
ncbi:MAG: hypothetical protein LBL84_02515 [Candidatus Nomurabacteria bacterium]|jgi:hypothetical protein|nr:hypothetical protein [Candidatus Nomurabacteria bacterium]